MTAWTETRCAAAVGAGSGRGVAAVRRAAALDAPARRAAAGSCAPATRRQKSPGAHQGAAVLSRARTADGCSRVEQEVVFGAGHRRAGAAHRRGAAGAAAAAARLGDPEGHDAARAVPHGPGRCIRRPQRGVLAEPQGGSLDEILTVYTIVKALTENLPAVNRVQILVDGREVDTLAGHVDLRRPLGRMTEWVEQPQRRDPNAQTHDRHDAIRSTPTRLNCVLTLTPNFIRARRRLGAHRGRPHARHLHGERRRPRAAVPAQLRQGLGDGRIRHAAARDHHADDPRGSDWQGGRAHAGNPAADRPIAPIRRAARRGWRADRSGWTATSSRPTAARAPPRSPARFVALVLALSKLREQATDRRRCR